MVAKKNEQNLEHILGSKKTLKKKRFPSKIFAINLGMLTRDVYPAFPFDLNLSISMGAKISWPCLTFYMVIFPKFLTQLDFKLLSNCRIYLRMAHQTRYR